MYSIKVLIYNMLWVLTIFLNEKLACNESWHADHELIQVVCMFDFQPAEKSCEIL